MSDAARVPYSVPTMEEIRALPWNGYTVASTFAGGGGSSTGYRMAGFRVLYANEFVDSARETYAANAAPYTVTDGRDIRSVKPGDLLDRMGVDAGDLDVLDGSPPCSAFSMAGKRSAGWGQVKKYSDTAQRVDDLFYEYARLIDGVQPRVFVAENVPGLVRGTAKGYFKAILSALSACGYTVSARVLDASRLGVPQARKRLIFVGVRKDLGVAPVHPKPMRGTYTVRDVFPYIEGIGEGGFGNDGMASSAMPARTIGRKFDSGSGSSPSGCVWGGKRTAPPRVHHDTSGAYSLGDVTDRPAPTVTVGVNSLNSVHFQVQEQGSARPPLWRGGSAYDPETGQDITVRTGAVARAHPDAALRKFTLKELRAVCGFPPDYALTGDYARRWERLGRAVPPLMMKAVAEAVRDEVLGKCAD